MPGFDGTGPAGGGPMTGGGQGYCNPGAARGFRDSWSRRSTGFGYGRGRGYRRMFWETGLPLWAQRRTDWRGKRPYRQFDRSQGDEVRMLKTETEILKADLKDIESRMKKLEALR